MEALVHSGLLLFSLSALKAFWLTGEISTIIHVHVCIRIRNFLGFLSPEKAAVCLQPPDIVFSNLALNKWMDGESMVDRVA